MKRRKPVKRNSVLQPYQNGCKRNFAAYDNAAGF